MTIFRCDKCLRDFDDSHAIKYVAIDFAYLEDDYAIQLCEKCAKEFRKYIEKFARVGENR